MSPDGNDLSLAANDQGDGRRGRKRESITPGMTPSRSPRHRRFALFGGILATALLATGCGTVTGSNATGSATISTAGQCPQLHTALTNLAALPYSEWNKPLSDLSLGPSVEQLGQPSTTKASDAYANLVGGTEWAKC